MASDQAGARGACARFRRMPKGASMPASRGSGPAGPGLSRISASQLYDFAVCEHRIALDVALDRSRRAPPDEPLRLLMRRGLALEDQLARQLGYETVSYAPDRPEEAFHRTLELMRGGVRGVYQGVLLSDRRIAIPDLLRRTDGPSGLGAFHYIPGDIKSGLEPRTDQVLQVVFSAGLLETIQAFRPRRGFLLLGDGTESEFAIEDVWDSAALATSHLEAVADGNRESAPFLSEHCARCRWRGECLPLLSQGPDLSNVSGMTRTRRRVLVRHGVTTARELAALSDARVIAMERDGASVEGLGALQRQARAFVGGEIHVRRHRPSSRVASALNRGAGLSEHFVIAERDPLGGGEPFLFGYASRTSAGEAVDRTEVLLAATDADRAEILRLLLEWIGEGDALLYHWGPSVPRSFARIADRVGVDAGRLGRIEARFLDLAPIVRSAAFLPVRRYTFAEVEAVLSGRELPDLQAPADELWVWFENHRAARAEDAPGLGGAVAGEADGEWLRGIERRVREALSGLVSIRDWVGRTLRTSR